MAIMKRSEIKPEIMKLQDEVIAVGMNKEEFLIECGFAIQAIANNDTLAKCPLSSIKTSVYNLALTALSLNPVLGLAYLVPRGGKCILDISYKGLIHLAVSSGGITSVHATVVYEKDDFEALEGTRQEIIHKPTLINDRGLIIGAYCIANLPDGSKKISLMNLQDLEQVRKTSKMKSGAIWNEWTAQMYIKTVIKRASKQWPKSDKLLQAIAIVNQTEGLAKIKTNGVVATSSLDIPAQENIPDTPGTNTVWDFTGDPEARIDKEKLVDIVKILDAQEINLAEMLKKLGIDKEINIKNRDLQSILEYIENA